MSYFLGADIGSVSIKLALVVKAIRESERYRSLLIPITCVGILSSFVFNFWFPFLLGVSVMVFYETMIQVREIKERRKVYSEANDFAHRKGKMLLVVGCPTNDIFFGRYHSEGDICIDIDTRKGSQYNNFRYGDVRQIPYPDKYFGAAFASMVLEHLPTVDDAKLALRELERVADRVYVLYPSKYSILAWAHRDHHLWVSQDNEITLKQRKLIWK